MGELSVLKATILGLIQGLTEFLPVSSSGHLVLAQHFFGLQSQNGELMAFDVLLHFGTLIAVATVFYRDIIAMLTGRNWTLVGLLILATLPAVVIGLPFKDAVEEAFSSVVLVSVALMVTGIVLGLTHYARVKSNESITWKKSLVIGLAQAVALLPGISRSGSTISAGLFLGLDRATAARFSFLMMLPAVSGAVILESSSVMNLHAASVFPAIIGTLVSAVVGYMAIRWMLAIIQKGKLQYFGLYCLIVGMVTLALTVVGR